MKNTLLVLFIVIGVFGCAATTPIDTHKCIKIANAVEKNGAKSSDDLYKECIDRQQQKNDTKKIFWEKSAEGLAFFVLDILVS